MTHAGRDQFWIGSDVLCTHCGHHNVLTSDFPVVVLKRIRTQGIVSIGFACESCQTRHLLKQDRAIVPPSAAALRRRRQQADS
jgi:hypothetical protein